MDMATYKEIQNYVKEYHRINVKTCWIAHMKEKFGLLTKIAPNRKDKNSRVKPCPQKYEGFIEEAFRHFGIIV